MKNNNQLLYQEKKELSLFWKTKKAFILGSFLILSFVYWAKIFYTNYSIDTEEFMIYGKENGFIQWLSIGRYGLFLMKQFVTGYDIDIRFINIMTYLFFFLSTVLLGYIFYRIFHKINTIQLMIIPILFVTSPIMLEQFNFILQSLEVSLSYLLVFLSVYICYITTHDKKRRGYLFSILFAVLSFSVYPSNAVSFIVLSVMVVMAILSVSKRHLTFKEYFCCSLPFMGVFVISFGLDKLFYTILLKVYGVTKGDYIDSAVFWGKMPIKEVFIHILSGLKQVYFLPKSVYFTYALLLGIILVLITIATRKENRLWLFMSFICLLIASNSNLVILGQIGPVRSMAPIIPLLTMFVYCFTVYFFKNNYFFILLLTIVVFFGLVQAKRTYQFTIQENNKFKAEVHYVHKMATQMKEEGVKDFSQYKLAVIGAKHFPEQVFTLSGEVLGASFFEWDHTSPVGSSGRVRNFFYTQGYPLQRISDKEYQNVLKLVQKNPMSADSVRVDGDIIILKLQ